MSTTTKIESVEQVEALPVGSVIEDKYHGYHVNYTKLETGKFHVTVLDAPTLFHRMDIELDAEYKNEAGGVPAELFQLGLDAGADLTVLATEATPSAEVAA